MTDKNLLDYILQGRASGLDDETIRKNLGERGWQPGDVERGFAALTAGSNQADLGDSPKQSSIIDLFKQSLAIYRANFSNLLVLSAIPVLAVMIAVGLGWLLVWAPISAKLISQLTIIIIPLLLAAVLGLVYLAMWSQVSLMVATRDNINHLTWRQAYEVGRPYLKPFFITALLNAFIGLGGLMFFIVPGILFPIWFSLSSVALIVENRPAGWPALTRSYEVVAGRSWFIFGRLLALAVIMWLASLIISIPFTFFPSPIGQTVEEGASYIIGVILGPLSVIYLYLLFKEIAEQPLKKSSAEVSKAIKIIGWIAIAGWCLLLVGLVGLIIIGSI